MRVCYSKDKIVEGINNAGALSPEDLKKEMQEFVFTDLFLIVSTNLKSRFHAITYLTQKSLVFLPSPCSAVNLCPTKKIRRRTLASGDKTLKQLMKPMIDHSQGPSDVKVDKSLRMRKLKSSNMQDMVKGIF